MARLAGPDRGTLFRASLITPPHPSGSRPRHRAGMGAIEIGGVDRPHTALGFTAQRLMFSLMSSSVRTQVRPIL